MHAYSLCMQNNCFNEIKSIMRDVSSDNSALQVLHSSAREGNIVLYFVLSTDIFLLFFFNSLAIRLTNEIMFSLKISTEILHVHM